MGLKLSPHEAKIQGGGITVHVVFKYVSRSLLYKWVVGGKRPSSVDVLFENDITIMLLYVSPVAKCIVPDWGDKVISGGSPGYIGWRVGTTTLYYTTKNQC